MIKYYCALIFLIVPILGFSQSNVNPDISLIGTFNTFINNIRETSEYGKINFETPEAELFIDGYLNPYARATGNIAYEEGEFSVEEVYAEIVRGLPLDVQIKAGKYLVGFGQLNIVHPHAWAFLDRPLFHQIFFSPEGFNDIGFNFSFILPMEDFYSNFDIGIFKGNVFSDNAITDSPILFEDRGNSPIVVARFGTFFSLSDYSNLGIGLDGSYGTYSKVSLNTLGDSNAELENKSLTYAYAGLDFKYKYRADDYTVFTIQGEGLLNNRNVAGYGGVGIDAPIENFKTITTYGAFLYFDYLFEKQYSFGAKYDYTYGIIGDESSYNTRANDDQNTTQGISAWLGYYPVEHTLAFRLGVQHLIFNYADGTKRDGETTATLQMIFSLGPHKAHPF